MYIKVVKLKKKNQQIQIMYKHAHPEPRVIVENYTCITDKSHMYTNNVHCYMHEETLNQDLFAHLTQTVRNTC